ncbi:helix-turn-helix domain-containing protein [Lusitaniella coriacea]|uniref:helix-turn-helix domain-containing protein n=1 Tax=Lusitaniella coriacea TaxID=1983105 RepID=UPI003CF32773
MIKIFSDREYEQLWEENFTHKKITTTVDNWSYTEAWESHLWQRDLCMFKLRHGLSLQIRMSENQNSWGVEFQHPQSYPLTLAFHVLGKVEALTPKIQRDRYYEQAGENYLFSVAGTQEIERKFGGEKSKSLRLHLDKGFLQTFFADELDELPQEIYPFLEGRNIPVFYRRGGRSTPAMKIVLKQFSTCPYRGTMKQIFLESKALELIALQFAQLRELQDRSSSSRYCSPQNLDAIHHAKEILTKNLENPPSLFELTQQVGLSERKLQQGFRVCFGTTVFKYLHRYRLEQSQQLLSEGRMSVAEVANTVGYSHLSHFAGAFRRQFGVNPSEYRVTRRG